MPGKPHALFDGGRWLDQCPTLPRCGLDGELPDNKMTHHSEKRVAECKLSNEE